MSKVDFSDPATIEQLTTALEAAGLDGIEITRPDQSLLIRLASDPNRKVAVRLRSKAEEPTTVKAPMAGMFFAGDPSRPVSATVPQGQDVVGFLRVGPILLPLEAGVSQRLRRHLVQSGTIVGFGDPLAEVEPEE